MSTDPRDGQRISKFVSANGEGRHGWPRVLGTILLLVACAAAVAVLVQLAVFPNIGPILKRADDQTQSTILVLLAGLAFAAAMAGLFLGTRRLHQRPVLSLITAAPSFRWKHLGLAFVVAAVLVGIGNYIDDPAAITRVREISPGLLVGSALLMLIAFFVQTSAEEIVFRGYVLQVAYRASRSYRIAAIVGVLFFTLIHVGYGIEAAVFSFAFAIATTIIVFMLDGIEFAIGMHLANNWVTATFFVPLAKANRPTPGGYDWQELALSLATMLILVLVAFLLRARGRDSEPS